MIRRQADVAAFREREARPRRHAWPRRFPRGFVKMLAFVYSVSPKTIYEILSRRRWKSV